MATVVSMLSTMRILLDTLEGIRRTGRVPLPESAVAVRPDGQVTLRVVPIVAYDRLIFPGVSARVWVEPESGPGGPGGQPRVLLHQGDDPPGRGVPGAGAGNVAAITVLDVVHKLFVDGSTVLLKFSRVSEYMAPHFERAFADLIAAGFVRTVYGGSRRQR